MHERERPEGLQLDRGAPPSSRADDRASLAARVGVTGDFIRVPQLARIIGISATSIHSQMRLGVFPVPHRRVGNVIVVKLDDYVDWYRSADQGEADRVEATSASSESLAQPSPAAVALPSAPSPNRRKQRGRESAKDFKERLNRQILARVRSEGLQV